MPAEKPHPDEERARTPECVLYAIDAGRALMQSAEEYHTATFMHDPIPAMLVQVRCMDPGLVGTARPDERLYRMHNYPLVPVTSTAGRWIPQSDWLSGSALVAIAANVKNRPALASSTVAETWKMTAACASAMRAAAWDYLRWVPTEAVIRTRIDPPGGMRIIPEGLGRTIIEAFKADWNGATKAEMEIILGQAYLSWKVAFILGYRAHKSPNARNQVRMLRQLLLSTASRLPQLTPMLETDSALVILCQAALTAVPPNLWTQVEADLRM